MSDAHVRGDEKVHATGGSDCQCGAGEVLWRLWGGWKTKTEEGRRTVVVNLSVPGSVSFLWGVAGVCGVLVEFLGRGEEGGGGRGGLRAHARLLWGCCWSLGVKDVAKTPQGSVKDFARL